MSDSPEIIDLSAHAPGVSAAIRALLAAVGASPGAGTSVTVAQYRDSQLPALFQTSAGTAGTYNAGLALLADGDHRICACTCPACLDPGGCPCPCGCAVDDGQHRGRTSREAEAAPHRGGCSGKAGACAARWTGRGDLPLHQLTVSDLEQAQHWAGVRAGKANLDRATRRSADDRSPVHDGRGAQENFVSGARWLLARAEADGLVSRSPAASLRKPERITGQARALTPEQAAEVVEAAASSGTDPDTDALIVLAFVQTAARCSGVRALAFGRLDVPRAVVRIKEPKRRGAEHDVCITPALAAALHAHALDRGPRRPAGPGANDEERRHGIPALAPTDPLLYRRPVDSFAADGTFAGRKVRPVTERSLENLRDRIRARLPWAAATRFGWHDLRRTTGTLLERIAGQAVAAYHLGHVIPATTTDVYVRATLEEDAAAISALFGCEHPLAGDAQRPGPGAGPRLVVVHGGAS